MNLNLMELIQSLHREKEILDRVIASLEEFQQISRPRPHSSGKRLGRKSMSVKGPAEFRPDKQILGGKKVRREAKEVTSKPRTILPDTSAPPLSRAKSTSEG
jgi:hypothetical protein